MDVQCKLTDFGAAREVKEEKQFASVCGTEEYMHPDIYDAFIHESVDKTFGVNVDLWSVGITLPCCYR
jgi:TANK-binding kinase 1